MPEIIVISQTRGRNLHLQGRSGTDYDLPSKQWIKLSKEKQLATWLIECSDLNSFWLWISFKWNWWNWLASRIRRW
jgi:hypothetical protein